MDGRSRGGSDGHARNRLRRLRQTRRMSNAPPAPELKATSVTAAAQQTTRPATGKNMDNPALNLAILSDVPADVCAMLGQAEAECLRFFALPDAVKRECTAASIAAAATTVGAGADAAKGDSGDVRVVPRVVSASHAEALAGNGPVGNVKVRWWWRGSQPPDRLRTGRCDCGGHPQGWWGATCHPALCC